MRVRLPLLLAVLLVSAAGPSSTAGPNELASALTDPVCEVHSISFEVNGRPAPLITARRGDEVSVRFTVPYGCENRMTFASFVAPDPAFDGSRLDAQALFSKATGEFGEGRHSMRIQVYDFPGDDVVDCSSAPRILGTAGAALRAEVQEEMAASPEYRDEVINEVRAKRAADPTAFHSQPFDQPCDSAAASNRSPCEGCVGSADDRSPPGQDPTGADGNLGYECDLNPGIGDGNPAHSDCRNFQVDLSYAGADPRTTSDPTTARRLIAAIFCVGTTDRCYATDRTESSAVFVR